MNTIARAYIPIEQIPVQERREHMEQLREMEVISRANDILSGTEELDEAIGDFGNAFSWTGLVICLGYIARCETPDQFQTHGAELKKHLKAIAYWKADQDTPPVSIFHKPQAGHGEG